MPFTIDQSKELAAGYQCLLLADFLFLSGDVLRLATREVTWNGNAYLGRLMDSDLGTVQMLSESGVDIPPSLRLHVADADGAIFANWERTAAGRGFRGAVVVARLVFFNVLTPEFSTDSIVRFTGICDPATAVDETTLEVTAQNRLNANRKFLPGALIGKHCWKIRPLTAEQCADAANEDSDFFPCGITDPAQPDCNNTRFGCMAADNLPRFSGVTFQPNRDGGKGKEYTSGQQVQLFNAGSEALYGEPFPLVLGRGWVECPVLCMLQDGNNTVLEVALCTGNIDTGRDATYSMRVVVNGYQMPPAGYDSPTGFVPVNPGNVGWWNWLTRGHRDGLSTSEVFARHNGLADPYGSLTTIEITVPRQVASGESKPHVSILFSGPKMRVYGTATSFSMQWTDNPVWHLLYCLIHSGWRYPDIDLDSFVSAAAVCAEAISYTSQYGYTLSHVRYRSNVLLRQRRQAGELIRGIRQNCMGMLQPNRADGRLALLIEGTLASQQPAPQPGSNYNTPLPSRTRAGDPANGYAAYHFTEDNTISVKGIPRPIAETPNRISFQFQDSENNYAPTSLAVTDSDDVDRIGQAVSSTVQIDGCASYDQAQRLLRQAHKKALRGNTAGDTRGTMWFEIQASYGALRVGAGQIVLLDWPKMALSGARLRVMGVRGPSRDGVITLTTAWHEDLWYVDSASQRPDPEYSNPRRDLLQRASFPACPDMTGAPAGDPLFNSTDRTFTLQPVWTYSPDGRWTGRIVITTKIAVNEFGTAQPPALRLQASVSAGGNIPPGSYFVAVAAVDAAGGHSPLSIDAGAVLESDGTLSIPVDWWDDLTVSHAIYAGRTPFRLTHQATPEGTPANITLADYAECAAGAPDQELDAIVAAGRYVIHSGIVGAELAGVAAGQLTIGGIWSPDVLAGYEASLIAKADESPLPVLNFRISGNTSDGKLNVTPDPVANGVMPGDVIVIRSKPVVTDGGKTFTDPNWHNPLSNNGAGLDPAQETGKVAMIVAGKGAGLTNIVASATTSSHTMASEWLTAPDSTSRIIILEPAWLPLTAPFRPITNNDPNRVIELSFPIENYAKRVILVALYTMDGSETRSVEAFDRVRELWVPGQPLGTVTITSDYSVRREDKNILIDTTNGPLAITLLPGAAMEGLEQFFSLIADGGTGNKATIAAQPGEDINGLPSIALGLGDNERSTLKLTAIE